MNPEVEEKITPLRIYRKTISSKKRKFAFELLSLIVILSAIILTGNFFLIWLTSLALIYSSLTLSWAFMEDMGGRTSLGHTIPFGLSAYLSAILLILTKRPESVLFSWIAAGMVSAIIFYILSRIDRVGFVFITFIVGASAWLISPLILLKVNGELIGGEEGFSIFTISLERIYIISSTFMILLFAFFSLFSLNYRSLVFKAMRDDEKAARASGIKIDRLKLYISIISCIPASISGGLYALLFSHVSPDSFSIHIAIFPFIASVFSRDESLSGRIVGSFILVFISNYMNSLLPESYLLLYAAILILSPRIVRMRFFRMEILGG
jgi:branched-chain amino acid transport system permease protein